MPSTPLSFCHNADEAPFEFENSRALLRCWQRHCRNGALPQANELDLASMKKLLPELLIYDVASPTMIRFRLAGTMVVKRMGFEPRGMNMIDLSPPAVRRDVGLAFSAVAGLRIGILSHFRHIYAGGTPGRVEMLMLPLAAPAGQAPRVMALLSREHFEGLSPYGLEQPAEAVENATLMDVGFGLPDLETILAKLAGAIAA